MEFDELMKIVEEKNKIEGEKCLICHFPDESSKLIKLSCNHYFHQSCLNIYKGKKTYFRCPYCDQPVKKCKQVNQINNSNLTCQVVLKSGINKGNICGRINCKYHKNKKILV